MARLPEIIRRNPISQVAATPAQAGAGAGWGALASVMQTANEFVKPAAEQQSRLEGEAAVYRDESGQLKVQPRSVYAGEMGAIHNSAAFAKYLSQKSIDISNTMNELYVEHQFNPEGFREAADGYLQILEDDENIPPVLKENLISKVREEGAQRFEGLYRSQVDRDFKESDTNTATQRDMLVDDYVNLYVAGDEEAAAAKWAEIEGISDFRSSAPYISETPAEQEQFMRGARGAAKAGRLIRDLEGLEGATSIDDQTRDEIMGVLEDPDISPNVRQRLYTATQGRLKGIDANAMIAGMTDSSYEAMVVRAESGGRADAAAGTSSALGHHQFVKDTWLGLVRKYKPSWAAGKDERSILAMRKDPAASSEMFQHFRRENQAALANAGLPVNPATEYMAHFFGSGDVVKVLGSSDDTLVSDIVSAGKINANPFLKGMTVRDAKNWAARKMTMKASDMAAMTQQVLAIPDEEMRGMAMDALRLKIQQRSAMEDAAAEVYRERLNAQDTSLTTQQVIEDTDLSNSDQSSLISAISTMRKEQTANQVTVANLNDPSFQWDIYDSGQRSDVNKAFSAATKGMDPMGPQALPQAAKIAGRTGFLPQTTFNSLRAAVNGNDPQAISDALEFTNSVLSAQPTAITPYGGRTDIENALSDYKRLSQFMTGPEAAQAMIDRRAEPPKNVTDQMKKLKKELEIGDIKDHFDQSAFSGVDMGSQLEQDEMMSEYSGLFEDAYLQTGDFDLAKGRALDQMDKIYGANDITGSSRVMKFPPQKFYPQVRGSHDWMTDQIETEVSKFVFGDDASDPGASLTARIVDGLSLGGASNWVRSGDIKMVSDGTTRAEIMAGQPPSYVVYYMKDGQLEQVPQRFEFDPSTERSEVERDFEAKRAEQNFDAGAQERYYRNVEIYGREVADQMYREETQGNAIPR